MAIRQKDNGRWIVDITRKGKRVFKQTVTDEQQAKKLHSEVERHLEKYGHTKYIKQREAQKSELTLSSLLAEALRAPEVWKSKSNSQPNNAQQCIEFLGKDRNPLDIERSDLLDLIAHLEEERDNSQNTINKKLSALAAVLKTGAILNLYDESAVYDPLKLTGKANKSGRTRVLSEDEIGTFRAALCKFDLEVQCYFLMFLYLGARPSELCQLELRDIDLGNGVVRILRGKKRGDPNEMWLPLLPQIREVTIKQYQATSNTGSGVSQRLFTSPELKKQHKAREVFKKIIAEMGLSEDKELVPYTLRHTCCTRLLKANVNLFIVKEWMGHTSINTTLKYAHYHPSMLAQVGQQLSVYEQGVTYRSASQPSIGHFATV